MKNVKVEFPMNLGSNVSLLFVFDFVRNEFVEVGTMTHLKFDFFDLLTSCFSFLRKETEEIKC